MTNHRTRPADPLHALTVAQKVSILERLVGDDKKIRIRVQQLAGEMLSSVDVDAIAEDVADAVDVDSEDVCACSPRDGYVDPVEEAWEHLDKRVAPFLDDLEERLRQGRIEEASRICQGIVLGLYHHRGGHPTTEKVIAMAEDFPFEAAGKPLDRYFGRRDAHGKRSTKTKVVRPSLPDEFWTRVADWSGLRKSR